MLSAEGRPGVLIATHRHTSDDLAEWKRLNRTDKILAEGTDWDKLTDRAILHIARFGPDMCNVSWGKDSVVVAHLCWLMAQRYEVKAPPLVFVRVIPRFSPEVDLVRDAFLERFPMEYHEIPIQFTPQPDGSWLKPSGRLTSSAGFAEAAKRFGPKYVSGIRAEESITRKKRVTAGLATKNTCAPIGWWKTPVVFAYLEHYGLPVHPAYGYLGGKAWERDRLRVSSLFGERGVEFGRRAWELLYYRDRWHELQGMAMEACSCP